MSVGDMRLDLGDLDLVSADGGYDSYWFEAVGEDVDFGEPQPVDVTLSSLMADGDPTTTSRYENRQIAFRVVLSAPDAQGLADGEAALLAECGKRNLLSWTPPDGYGPTTVFAVETSRVRFLFNDLDEVRGRKQRTFQLTLTCLPFARSVEPTTVGSDFASDSVDIEDDCESTTGWSSYGSTVPTYSVDSTAGNFVTGTGAVKLLAEPYYWDTTPAGAGGYITHEAYVRKTLAIDASGGGYLVMAVRSEWGSAVFGDGFATITTSGGGAASVPVLAMGALGNGFSLYGFEVPHASTITKFEARVTQGKAAPAGSLATSPAWWFDQIGLSGTAAAKQLTRSFEVEGSMRTEGSFALSAAVGLGDVLFYTCPDLGDGFRPDLRRWQTAGSPTVDAAAVNGSYLNSGITTTFEAPASIFRPGAYAVLARVDDTTTLTVEAQLEIAGTPVGESQEITVVPPGGITTYSIIRVGVLDLPPLAVSAASSEAKVLFTVSGSWRLDELWVFPLEDSALTWVECGSGSPSSTVASRLWLEAPSPSLPRGLLTVGNDADQLDARYQRPNSRGRHLLAPGTMLAHVVTTGTASAELSTTFFRTWHSNAAG